MDLTKLQWTKNVAREDGKWAYQQIDLNSQIFELHFSPDAEKNARKPKEDELIILRQKTKVTHIVKVINNTLYPKKTQYDWIFRLVKAVWIAEFWSEPPEQNKVFGYRIKYQGGKAMKLEELPTFKQHWDCKGGINAFQQHVKKQLKI